MSTQSTVNAATRAGDRVLPPGRPKANCAPSGLEPAAPSLLEQAWTGDGGEVSRELRPARPRVVHAVTSVGATFCWPVRVYWEDTDAGGVVFYANYLKFFERARTEWLRARGIEQQALRASTGGMFVVSDTHVKYHAPARLDDELIVTARALEIGRACLTIGQDARIGASPAGRLLCEATIRIGWVTGNPFKPARIPPTVLEALQ